MGTFRHFIMPLAGISALTLSSATTADTAIATRWKPLGETQNDCMAHAQMAIWRSGFDKSDPSSQSMSGKRGEYTASIRCMADQQIVLFVTAGPSPDATAQYLDVLYGHF
mgnify:CR=1 FL=1|jgi:hypothetical protein